MTKEIYTKFPMCYNMLMLIYDKCAIFNDEKIEVSKVKDINNKYRYIHFLSDRNLIEITKSKKDNRICLVNLTSDGVKMINSLKTIQELENKKNKGLKF